MEMSDIGINLKDKYREAEVHKIQAQSRKSDVF